MIEAIWITFYAVSLFLTVYSIIRLFAIINAVVKINRKLKLNYFQLIAHCFVLVSAMTGVIISLIYFKHGT